MWSDRSDIGDRIDFDPWNGTRASRKKLVGSLAARNPSANAASTRSRSVTALLGSLPPGLGSP
jgi:hypothetical protein